MSKRILILTADVGFGHRAAANAISSALVEHYGDACQIVVANPMADRRTPALLRRAQSNYDRMVQEVPELYEFGYRASDGTLSVSIVEQALIALLYTAIKDTLQTHEPDAIITTYPLYQAPLAAAFALSRSYVPLLTVITDLVGVHSVWFSDEVDLCLVPTDAVRTEALDHGLTPERVEVTGLPVNPALARRVDKAELRARLGLRHDRTVALFVGSQRVKRLEPVSQVLNHSGLPLELVLVAGGNQDLLSQWQRAEWHLPAHIHGFVDDLISLVQAADLIVCKAGGLITSEALAAGLPILMVEAIPGQETGNAEYIVREGAGELTREPLEALTCLCHWLDKGGMLLAQRAADAARLGRPQAAYRVADLAWQAAQLGVQRKEHRLLSQVGLLRELLSRPLPRRR